VRDEQRLENEKAVFQTPFSGNDERELNFLKRYFQKNG